MPPLGPICTVSVSINGVDISTLYEGDEIMLTTGVAALSTLGCAFCRMISANHLGKSIDWKQPWYKKKLTRVFPLSILGVLSFLNLLITSALIWYCLSLWTGSSNQWVKFSLAASIKTDGCTRHQQAACRWGGNSTFRVLGSACCRSLLQVLREPDKRWRRPRSPVL